MKYLLFLILFVIIIVRVSGFLMRMLYNATGTATPKGRKGKDIHVDHVPKDRGKGHIKGGDYIDYEEV